MDRYTVLVSEFPEFNSFVGIVCNHRMRDQKCDNYSVRDSPGLSVGRVVVAKLLELEVDLKH